MNNEYKNKKILIFKTNFDYKRIQTLYSNLSSLNIAQLIELRKNYKKLNYSITEIDLQLLKLISTRTLILLGQNLTQEHKVFLVGYVVK